MEFRSGPTRPGEYALIAATLAGLLIAFGLAALFVAFRAPPEKAQLAAALLHYGYWSLGIGAAIASLLWLFRRTVH